MKRQRGRNRRNNNSNNHGNANRSLESNGPDVKVRGTAKQIFDKYETLARDAASSGSRVKAENYRQHAEHYLRIVNAIEAAKPAPKPEVEVTSADTSNKDSENTKTEADKDGADANVKGRTKRRYPPQVKKASKTDSEDVSGESASAESGPDSGSASEQDVVTITPDEDAKPVTKSTRRRKAPSRETSKDDTATEAAE